MGSEGSSLVGMPSSSTSGGWEIGGRGKGSTPESIDSLRVRRMGGGAASSESESASGLESVVAVFSSGTLRECKRQKLKKLGQLASGMETKGCYMLQLLLFALEVDNLLDLLQLQQFQDQGHVARIDK